MAPQELDPHGQPLIGELNASRRTIRDVSELLGLAKAMLLDGVVTDAEAQYLLQWSKGHAEELDRWPLNVLFKRLAGYFQDGRIDEAERADLQELLAAIVGGTASLVLGYDGATALPLDKPAPLMCYGPDEVYVFTGRFAYAPRRECQKEVIERAGVCEDNVTRRTSFLVIGTFGSRDWATSSFGRKIQRAVELRQSGFPIRIVGEDHWASNLR